MARQEFTVGDLTAFGTEQRGWRFSTPYPQIDAELTGVSEAIYLVQFDLLNNNADQDQRIFITDNPNDAEFAETGEELSATLKSSLVAVRIRAGDLSIAVPGPTVASNQLLDSEEPYHWQVSSGKVTEINTFLTGFANLSQADKNATILTLDDGQGLNMRLGDTEITRVYVGSTEITRAYVGGTEI